jgi:hypothetical protein
MPNKPYGTVRKDQLAKLPTPELIAEYDIAISSYDGRFTNASPRQKRINYVVDLLTDRADNGDDTAQEWLDAAK